MRFYWSLKSVPELADLSPAERRRVWQAAWRESGGMSYPEIVVVGLAHWGRHLGRWEAASASESSYYQSCRVWLRDSDLR